MALCAQRLFIRPMHRIMAAMRQIAAGNFDARVDLGRGYLPREVRASAEAVNAAAELGNVEMLRLDFIDSFSHEFKTPIMSLNGFARLLKTADLLDEQRREFLDAIIEGSERLANLSESILSLTRAASQTILPRREPVNLSERIRRAVLGIESRWASRDVSLRIELEEATYAGDEELLDHVWTNLLDNAVRLSPEGGIARVALHRFPNSIAFSVSNEGEGGTGGVLAPSSADARAASAGLSRTPAAAARPPRQ